MADKEEKALRSKAKKRNLILMDRDIDALLQLYLHRAVASSQLALMVFGDISYETARKRLRRLQQAGYTASASSGRMEGRGRPELIYFLTASGAKALEQSQGISWESIPTGPPHAYHKEHFLRLVDMRLALERAANQGLIQDLDWHTGREFWRELSMTSEVHEESADASIGFSYPSGEKLRVLLEMDTGNFRQTRHWEPKIRSFLKSGNPIWVVTGSSTRIMTLRKWTAPLLEEFGFGPGRCVFSVYSEIMERGLFGALWYRTDGSLTNLRPRSGDANSQPGRPA